MPKLFELKQERHQKAQEIEQIVLSAGQQKRALSDRDQVDLVLLRDEVNDLDAAIKPLEGLNSLASKCGPNGFFGSATPTTPAAINGVPGSGLSLRKAMESATSAEAEQVRAFTQYLGGDMEALANLAPSGDGGVFIPTIIAGVIAHNYSAFSPVRDNATVWPTEGGEPTTFPVISDSETATILAPAALTGLDDVVSGDTPATAITGPLMNAYKFSSKPVFIPRETLTDANVDVMEEMLSALLARIARLQNLKYTKGAGSGSGEPRGFLTDATPYAAGSVALDLDIALDLAYSVPAMYRPEGLFMASDTTIRYLRKLKTGVSGDKRALWKDVFEEGNATLGTPAKLHGYPIVVNNDMDSVAADGTFAGVSPLAFGNFKRFVVREAERGTPYIYRWQVPAKDGGAVIAFQRSDSKLLVSSAISKLTVS